VSRARSGNAIVARRAREEGGTSLRGWLAASPSRRLWRLGLRMAGAGLLAATGAIHLDLYLTGYRSIPVIGWMFMLQVITAFGLAVAVLASGSRLLAAAGGGFALATLGGYLLSTWVGLFGVQRDPHRRRDCRRGDRGGRFRGAGRLRRHAHRDSSAGQAGHRWQSAADLVPW